MQWKFAWTWILAVFSPWADAAEKAPNLIVIYCDDAGYGDFGFTGHPTIQTPHLDQMAEEGARFTQFYSGAPACSASRYALLTGRSPARSGLMNWVLFPNSARYLHPSETTLAELLKRKGYETAIFGKWHLGFPNEANQHSTDTLPPAHGFDTWLGLPYSNDMLPARKFPNLRLLRYPPAEKAANTFGGCEVLSENPDQSLLTQSYTAGLTDWIRQNKDRPFFAYLAHTMPHIPLFTHSEQAGKSRRGTYGDVMQEIDTSTGEILKTLRTLGLDRNTLVIFSSDNGPWLSHRLEGGSSGLFRGGKGSTWEGGIHVPGLFWWPQTIPAGLKILEPASVLDLWPTVAALLKETPPSGRTLDGANLLPLLAPAHFPGEFPPDRIIPFTSGKNTLIAMRRGPWKIHYQNTSSMGGENENPFGKFTRREPGLFQIENDPSESTNLVSKKPEIIALLDQQATAFEQSLKDEPSEWESKPSPAAN
jgi:arylsulfatase A